MVAGAAAMMAVVAASAVAQTALRMGTSSSGSVPYILTVGFTSMLTKHAGIAATTEPVGGSSANVFAIAADKIDLAFSTTFAAYQGYHGLKPFKKKAAIGLFVQGAPSYRHVIVRTGSGIDKPEDLAGKTMIGIRPALPEIGLMTNALLKVYNLTGKVRVVSTTNTPEAINAIKSDTVDAVVLPASARTSYVTQLCRDGKIKFLSIPDDKLKAMRALLPRSLSSVTLPANTYPGQDKPMPTFGVRSIFIAASRLSDDTVYTVTKTLFDNIDEFHKFHATAKEWTLQETLADPVIPFHPGAIRYFKEKKLWTPAMDKEQEELKKE